MDRPFDAVIAGGGLSGLSLAAHLAAGGWADRRVLLVDDDRADAARAWGSWTDSPPGGALLDAAESRSYQRVRAHCGGHPLLLPLGRYRYRLVRRDDLRRVVLDLLADCPGFEVRTGRVERIGTDGPTAVTVVDGHPVRATWAFDSVGATTGAHPGPGHRPAAGAPFPVDAGSSADAHLAFTGWQVRCREAVFDADAPVLFDFRTARGDDARFVYVLPTGVREALVELTCFVPRRRPAPSVADREAALVAYLRDVLHCRRYVVGRTESAVLPLQAFAPPRRHGRVLAIGATAGLIKASTGYAYPRVQRDSAAVARSLARHRHPFAVPPPGLRYRAMDAVLLAVLERSPGRLEEAFDALFRANPVERVLDFLDERCPPADLLRLIGALPPAPYLAATAFRAVRAVAGRTAVRTARRTRP